MLKVPKITTKNILIYRFRQMLAVFYLLGFILHCLDVLNLRIRFSEVDMIWKVWIIFLLIFDLLASIGLYRQKLWGDILFILIAFTQLFAYIQFSSFFGDQRFLIYFHIVCLGVYGALKFWNIYRPISASSMNSNKK